MTIKQILLENVTKGNKIVRLSPEIVEKQKIEFIEQCKKMSKDAQIRNANSRKDADFIFV